MENDGKAAFSSQSSAISLRQKEKMKKKKSAKVKFKYIFGPVQSWRLGRSLGVDLTPHDKKTCNFDCMYCQLGKTKKHFVERKIFVPTAKVISELKKLPEVKIDHITFSGCGEPTLAKNLGQAITQIKKIRKEPVVVITNSSLISRKDVQEELLKADVIFFKLDASSEVMLKALNNPAAYIKFEDILKGLKEFRGRFKGKFALQLMFVEENKWCAGDMAVIARNLDPDEVQINTPTRKGGAKSLNESEIEDLKRYFEMFKVVSVFDVKNDKASSKTYGNTETRHPTE